MFLIFCYIIQIIGGIFESVDSFSNAISGDDDYNDYGEYDYYYYDEKSKTEWMFLCLL